MLGLPFLIFLTAATLLSLGKASEAFLLLRAQGLGVALITLPLRYTAYKITAAFLSAPVGIVADRIGRRNMFMIGIVIFSWTYFLFGRVSSTLALWPLFIIYGVYSALTEGVGRAIVADLVPEERRGTAYGIYNACTGLALLPASLIFSILWDRFNPAIPFYWGSFLGILAFVVFMFLRHRSRHGTTRALPAMS